VLSDEVRDFIKGGAFATLTTLLPDGRPAAQVMWIDCDVECVLINTELHRQKFTNVEGDPRVVVCVWEKDDPYHYVEVRGDVVEIVRGEPARKHIDELALRYFDRLYRSEDIQSERVILRIRPTGKLTIHRGNRSDASE
jgi:PPOX class probable F420-dependent enzyme